MKESTCTVLAVADLVGAITPSISFDLNLTEKAIGTLHMWNKFIQECEVNIVSSVSISHSCNNFLTQNGMTALYAASQEGHDEVVKILVRAKADINLQTNVSNQTVASTYIQPEWKCENQLMYHTER